MSMLGTMAKLAAGAMIAKGVSSAVRGGGAGGGLGGLLGGAMGGAGGGLGSLLGGGAQGQQGGGGLAGGLGSLLGGGSQGQQGGGGGLGDLGALLGGNSAGGASPGGAGGLGGLLESVGGGGQASNAQAPGSGSLGHLLNDALTGEEAQPQTTPEQEEQLKILISAMIAGAKADGNVDQEEQQKIVAQLGEDLTADEKAFVIKEMQSPLDVDALVSSIPAGSEQQAYMMAMMGMTLDTKEEAVFLDTFRKGMNISEDQANAIHTQIGVPTLYG